MSKAIRYRNLEPDHAGHTVGQRRAARAPQTTTTNDDHVGHQPSTAKAAAVSLGTLVGVRVLSSGGNLTTLGSAQKFGSPAQRGNSATMAIAPGPQQSYWTIDTRRQRAGLRRRHRLRLDDHRPATPRPAVDPGRTRAGTGYWILTTAGGVWAFGSASWYGSVARSNPGVGALRMHATPVGQGLLDPGRRRRHVRLRRCHLVRLGGQVRRRRRRRLLADADRQGLLGA